MLSILRVKNLALAETARVEFLPGLNVITGETGAGKSLLLDALQLLIGERADRSLIRAGEDACGTEALFVLKDPSDVDEALESFGLESCADNQLIIRRIVRASGSNDIRVNDTPVTTHVLKRLGDLLMDLHGPHDHQSLLNSEFQLQLLDSHGHLWEEREIYEEAYGQWTALREERDQLNGTRDVAEKIDVLTFKAQELEAAALSEEEERQIVEEQRVAGSAARILELGTAVAAALQDEEHSAFDTLVAAQRPLDELARLLPAAAAWRDEIRDSAARIQSLAAAIAGELSRMDVDPARLQWLDERLATYQKMKRKYGGSVAGALEEYQKSRERLQALQHIGERLAVLDNDIQRAEKKVCELGGALSEKRNEAGHTLAQAVTRQLIELGFPHGAFTVHLAPCDPKASGIDQIEFGFAPNAGEPENPLRSIASSGEISRVMLALKVVLAQHDRIPLLVFDEIDANVGGEMGHAIGRKLREVARTHQVICVTHLPQVAACGHVQFAVSKTIRDGRTISEVTHLDTDELRVVEIARMLGGRDPTPVTLQHAREMLQAGAT